MADEPTQEPPKPEEAKHNEVITEPDSFLDDIYEDYKTRLGKSYNKSLEKMDKKQAILAMKIALTMIPEQKKDEKPQNPPLDKNKKPQNPSNPEPNQQLPSNVYTPEQRGEFMKTLKTTGGYVGMNQKIMNRIKELQTR
jgi:hypothetical protein